MRYLAMKVAKYFLNMDYIEEDEYEFYCFTLESIFIGIINYFTMLLIAIALAIWSSSYVMVGDAALILLYALCITIICKYAPCIHPNNPISAQGAKRHRRKSIMFSLGVVVITIILKCLGYEKYVTLCIYSMVIS